MIDYIKRRFTRGSIFYFPGYDDYFILAQIGTSEFNLISLLDGNRKTTNWISPDYPENIRIPKYTWENGGPPEVVFVPENRNRGLQEANEVIDVIKNHKALDIKNLNEDLMGTIKTLL